MNNWFRRHVLEPLLAQLKQGTSPERLSLCVAIGIVVGLVPILGVSTLLCTAIALLFRLNLPAIQVAQASMAPLQILLIIPFVRLGEWIVRAPPQPLTVQGSLAILAAGVGHAIVTLWSAIVHGAIAWLLVAPPAALLITQLLKPLFRSAAAQLRRRPA